MVHQFKLDGHNIVLDVFSGAIHSVDDLAYDIIRLFESDTKEQITTKMLEKYADDPLVDEGEICDCISDIEELLDAGQLFTKDNFAPHAGELKERNRAIKALCLHVAHTCNLTCDYCFAAQGKYHGERALMSFEVGKRALDFLIENSGSQYNLEVDFFGGEPLMNWDVVKRLVEYARNIEKAAGKNFRFTLTTNGVLIDDDVIEFSNREMTNVVLSLDGRPEIHDRLRRTPNNKGSYDLIVPKFQKFAAARGKGEYYMRGTFTHNNVEFTKDIFHMADLGFTELSMEPVVCAPDDPSALTEADLPVLFEQYEILAREMLTRKKEGRPLTFYHYMIDLERGPCVYKRISGCGAGTEYFAVTPWGELFPCHQFVGDEVYSMGNVFDGVTNAPMLERFKACNAYAREACSDCWAKLFCSGGCAANAYHSNGDITGIYEYGCRLFKKRIECAIMMKVAESEDE